MNAADHFSLGESFTAEAERAFISDVLPVAAAAAAIAQAHFAAALAAVERDSLILNRRIYGSAVAYAALAEPEPEPACGEVCCSPGEPRTHPCTQIAGHGGQHVSGHTAWES
jgi:hypothetical protein